MSRGCRLERGGESLAASWELTEDALLLEPQGRPAEAWPIAEVRFVDWSEWNVRLGVGAGELTLSRLGAETDGLVAALRRAWPPLRAAALHVAGDGEPQRFAGFVATAGDGQAEPAEILVWPDAVVAAPRGRDVEALLLGQVAEVAEDAAAWAVVARLWDGSSWTFSRLAGDTARLAAALGAARSGLAAAAARALAASLPGLDPSVRARLAANWPPGRLLSQGELEGLAPGFGRALAASWLPSLPRRREGELLLAEAGQGRALLGYRLEAQGGEGEGPDAAASGDVPAAVDAGVAPAPPEGATLAGADLWAVVPVGGGLLVEDLGAPDVATYVLCGGAELVAAVTFWLGAPRMPREVVYLGVDALTGERASLVAAARDLAPLVALRSAFVRRVIHRELQGWSATIRGLLSGGVTPAGGA